MRSAVSLTYIVPYVVVVSGHAPVLFISPENLVLSVEDNIAPPEVLLSSTQNHAIALFEMIIFCINKNKKIKKNIFIKVFFNIKLFVY